MAEAAPDHTHEDLGVKMGRRLSEAFRQAQLEEMARDAQRRQVADAHARLSELEREVISLRRRTLRDATILIGCVAGVAAIRKRWTR